MGLRLSVSYLTEFLPNHSLIIVFSKYNFHINDNVTLVLIQLQYFVGLRVGKVRNISIRKGKG